MNAEVPREEYLSVGNMTTSETAAHSLTASHERPIAVLRAKMSPYPRITDGLTYRVLTIPVYIQP